MQEAAATRSEFGTTNELHYFQQRRGAEDSFGSDAEMIKVGQESAVAPFRGKLGTSSLLGDGDPSWSQAMASMQPFSLTRASSGPLSEFPCSI